MDSMLAPPNPLLRNLRKNKASIWTTPSLQLWRKCGFVLKVPQTQESLELRGLQQQEAQLEAGLQEEQVWKSLLWVSSEY